MVPALADRDPTAAYLFYDCQTDDVRLVLTVLGEAERYGAVVAGGCEAEGLAERSGRAAGLLVCDVAAGALRAGCGERGERHRGVGGPAAPGRALRGGGGAPDPPQPRHARSRRARHSTWAPPA